MTRRHRLFLVLIVAFAIVAFVVGHGVLANQVLAFVGFLVVLGLLVLMSRRR
jgi:hypothetical protein